jgi:hypothetical protein
VPAWYRGALRALVAAGAITPAERRLWIAHAKEALSGAPPAPAPSPALLRRASELFSEADRSSERNELFEALADFGITVDGQPSVQPDMLAPPPAFASGQPSRLRLSTEVLERVVTPSPLPGATQLVSVELYDGGVVLHWCTAPTADGDDAREPSWTQLEDDVETPYLLVTGGGGSCGSGTPTTGTDGFAPAVPESASMLRITRGGIRIELRVGD